VEPARGYVGLTDPDWYSYLERQTHLDEVNFWQPRGHRAFRALHPGEPFFFKLRAPHKAIAGFGFFTRYEALPAWLAWECFTEANGAADFGSMIHRILRLRKESGRAARMGEFLIGCIMISAPVFFSRDEWIDPPADWARTGIQQGKRYSLHDGEGRRVWEQCLERAEGGGRYWNVEPTEPLVARDEPRYGTPSLVRPRMGQGLFRRVVCEAYGGACAVTSEHSVPVLEAAHIVPYSQGGVHSVDNGLLLRQDLHRLFDRGYVTVTPDFVFRVGDSLRNEFHNGRTYYGLDGTPITLPSETALKPDREKLEWHGRMVYKG